MTLSDKIRSARHGVVHNPYQGADKKVVFVCSMGILRSATAARLYSQKYNTRSAGTDREALVPLTPLLVEWADELVFVNQENFQIYMKHMALETGYEPNIRVLDIPDEYEHMHPRLVDAFREQYEDF